MCAIFSHPQFVFRASFHDIVAVVDITLQHVLYGHLLRPAVDQRNHIGRKRRFQLGVFVELIQNHIPDGIAFEFHHNTQPIAVGFILNI